MSEVSLGWDGLDVMYKTFALTFQTLMYGTCIGFEGWCVLTCPSLQAFTAS